MTYESAYNKFSYLIFIVLSFPLGALIYIYLTEPEESKPCLIFGVLLMSLFLFYYMPTKILDIQSIKIFSRIK